MSSAFNRKFSAVGVRLSIWLGELFGAFVDHSVVRFMGRRDSFLVFVAAKRTGVDFQMLYFDPHCLKQPCAGVGYGFDFAKFSGVAEGTVTQGILIQFPILPISLKPEAIFFKPVFLPFEFRALGFQCGQFTDLGFDAV